MLVSVAHATQSGVVVVSSSVQPATKTTPSESQQRSKRVALRQALTLANKAGKFVIAEPTTTGKTKDIVKFLADNKLADTRRVLLVADKKTDELIRATSQHPELLNLSAACTSVSSISSTQITLSSHLPQSATVEEWLKKEEA